MVDGVEAVNCYEKGVEILKQEYAVAVAEGQHGMQSTIKQQIAAAYASVAELYMTDLCYSADAEVFFSILNCTLYTSYFI